jgi:hypothetical protein
VNVTFKFVLNLDGLRNERSRIRQRLGRAVTDTVESLQERIEGKMRAPKSGRVYRRPGGQHQASAPGEAPAIDTRALIESGHIEPTGELSADLVYDDPSAVRLELGTVRMAARPFMGPAMEEERPEFEHRVADVLAGVGASGRVRTRNPG